MIFYSKFVLFFIVVFLLNTCITRLRREEQVPARSPRTNKMHKGTFGYDVSFLQKYDSLVVLSDASKKAQVIVSPKLQGRVMTSTADGKYGKSYGWINYELISSN